MKGVTRSEALAETHALGGAAADVIRRYGSRRAVGVVASFACLSLALAACAGDGSPSAAVASGGGPSSGATSSEAAAPTLLSAGSSPAPTVAFCPGRTWPPYHLGGVPGITAVSTDRATVEITNRTDRTYYYRVSGWELDQFETCRAFGVLELQEGPIAPGATEFVMVHPEWEQEGIRVTVALWDKPCGGSCVREPLAAIVVELSPVEPASS